MAEIVNTVERARHVRGHKGGDDVAMVQTGMRIRNKKPGLTTEKMDEEVALVQTALDVFRQPEGRKMGSADWFFNRHRYDLKADLESSTSLAVNTKAILLGRKLGMYRSKSPPPEGLGLDRLARLGALLAAFELLHGVDPEPSAEAHAWADETWQLFLVFIGSNIDMQRNGTVGCTRLRPDGSRPEAAPLASLSATNLMYIADSLEEQDQEQRNEAGSSSAGPAARGGSTAAVARETDTIEGMLEEEIALQQEREWQQELKRQRVWEDIEKHE